MTSCKACWRGDVGVGRVPDYSFNIISESNSSEFRYGVFCVDVFMFCVFGNGMLYAALTGLRTIVFLCNRGLLLACR